MVLYGSLELPTNWYHCPSTLITPSPASGVQVDVVGHDLLLLMMTLSHLSRGTPRDRDGEGDGLTWRCRDAQSKASL